MKVFSLSDPSDDVTETNVPDDLYYTAVSASKIGDGIPRWIYLVDAWLKFDFEETPFSDNTQESKLVSYEKVGEVVVVYGEYGTRNMGFQIIFSLTDEAAARYESEKASGKRCWKCGTLDPFEPNEPGCNACQDNKQAIIEDAERRAGWDPTP